MFSSQRRIVENTHDIDFFILLFLYIDLKGEILAEGTTGETPLPEPAKDLLNLARNEKIETLYFREGNTDGMTDLFFHKILPHVVMKRKWNSNSHLRLMETFVTKSDEALAMLILENNAERWYEEAKFPNRSRHERAKAKYTNDGGPDSGWSQVGMVRFFKIVQHLEQAKKDNVQGYQNIQQQVKSKEKEINSSNRRKRRKIYQDNVSEAPAKEEIAALEAFLMGGEMIASAVQEQQNEEEEEERPEDQRGLEIANNANENGSDDRLNQGLEIPGLQAGV